MIFTYVPLLSRRVTPQVYTAIRVQLLRQKSNSKSIVPSFQLIVGLYYLSYRIPSTTRQYLSFVINVQRFSVYLLTIRVIRTISVITSNLIIRLLITLRFRGFFKVQQKSQYFSAKPSLIKARPVAPKSIRASIRVLVPSLVRQALNTKYYPSSKASLTPAPIDATISFRDSRFSPTLGLSARSRTTLFPLALPLLSRPPYLLLDSQGPPGNLVRSVLASRSIYRLLL